jgi:hypothetical protein
MGTSTDSAFFVPLLFDFACGAELLREGAVPALERQDEEDAEEEEGRQLTLSKI